MEKINFRLTKKMSEYLNIISKETKDSRSKVIRKALDEYFENYFSDKYIIPRIYEEWAKDDFKTYPIDELLKKNL